MPNIAFVIAVFGVGSLFVAFVNYTLARKKLEKTN